ncbi:macrophage colony-stimulating factor 1 isoform X1 [Thamnophis elegans]|uniref:macrophage colony-stimulating factor 1 isoform X1 n=1 Tax=Thamnophis elegans TaxID=35005 RepID=UPI0013768916|nr:macrophage colony-stimulating factor 1 isoform X1 [Thamnophis elegans]
MFASMQLALFLLATCGIHVTEQNHSGCHRLIMASHLKNLTDLLDSQMVTSCLRSFEYVDERELDNTECFLKAAYHPLKGIIDNITFKSNTPNYVKLGLIKGLYVNLAKCIKPHDDKNKKCIKTFSRTAEQTLQLVHKYFSQAKQFLSKATFTDDCSGVFQKCSESQEKDAVSPGVVSALDCNCSSTDPINVEGSTYLVPTSESFSSIAEQLDSRKTAVSIRQLRLPDTTQIHSGLESNTRSRVTRSADKSQEITESMDFEVGIDVLLSSPSSPSLSIQKQLESMETRSPSLDSRTGESQKRSDELASQHLPLSDLAKSFLNQQWFEIKDKTEAISGLTSDQNITVASSAFRLTLTSPSNLEEIDSSSAPSSGSPQVLGHKELVSATQDPSRFVATTENSSPPKQTSLESNSWGKQSSRDKNSKRLQNTQLRERREEGLAKKDRELEDSLLGPSFDLNFIPLNAEKRFKKSEPRNFQGTSVTYVVIPSVLGILLALGGLLFYLHKSRILRKRRTQQIGNNIERTEEQRSLSGGEGHLELQIQREV